LKPVIISKRNGKDIEFHTQPENDKISEYLEVFKTLMGRQFNPFKRIVVESINGIPAVESPYGKALLDFGFTREYKSLILRRIYSQ